MSDAPNPHVWGIDISNVIECAAQLVDGPVGVGEEYRRGVVELAARLCLCEDFDAMVEVMGYAVCGVNRPAPVTEDADEELAQDIPSIGTRKERP